MTNKIKLFVVTLITLFSYALFSQQAPSCPTNSIIAHNGSSINNHSLPNGPLGTILNNLPGGAGGLAVGPAFSFPAPNPTWWTTSGGTYWYYNNTGTWSNTGHASGGVNIGGGGSVIYNLVGGTGQIFVYNGTANNTLLTTLVPAFNGGGPYDVVADLANNFYILKADVSQGIYCYNPSGVLTCSWAVTGMLSQTAGGGFAILTTSNPSIHTMYYNSNGTDYIGNMIPGNSTIISTVQPLPGGSDYASCALPIPTGTILAPLGASLSCSIPQIPLVAQAFGNASLGWMGGYNTNTTTAVTPTCGSITWSGPGILNGQGTATINVNQPGVYSYTLTGCNGCPGYSITASITVIGQGAVIVPSIILSNTLSCSTTTTQLTTTPIPPGYTYTWTGPGLMSSNSNTAIINISGIYTVAVSSSTSACAGTQTIFVPTNTIAPTLTVTPTNTTICFGQSATFSVSGAVSYVWSNSQTTTSITVSPTTSAQYSVVGTGTNGCTSTVVANVSITPLPTPSITSNSPVCATKTLNLNASGATTYNWAGPNGFTSTLQNPSITNVSILASGVYTLIGTSGTCSASTTANITINALPTPNIISNSPVCQAQTLNLQGSGGVSYAWTGPNGFTSTLQNPSISNAQLVNGGTYSLTVTAANTCSNTTNALITVNATPPALATGSTVCAGQNLALTANILAGATYAWSGPNGFTSNLQNPVITNAQLSATGAYNLIVTSSVGCTNTAVTNASVIALPIPILGSNSPVCATKTLNLTGNGGNSYAWVGPNGFTSLQQNPIINNVTTLGSGMYTLVATVGNCSAAVTASITINALPTPIAANTGSVCETKSLTLTSNGGTSYSWTGPNNFTSNQQNPVINATALSQSGVYVVVVTDVNGCVNNAQTTVLINPNPNVIASGGIYCVGNSASVTANGGSVYNWSGPNGFTSNLQSPQLGNATFSLAGNYVVLVTAANTCTSINSASVGVVQLVQPTISNNGPICVNQQLSFTSSGGYIYSWVGPNNFVSNQANPSIIADDMGYAGTYLLTVADNNGCSNSVSTQVVINPLPTGELISSSTKNCVPFCANFSVTSTNSNLQATTWINTNGGTVTGNVLSRCFTTAGDYNFKASYTDNNGCTNTSSFVATAYPLPVADFNFTPEKPIEAIDEVYFTDATTIGGPATQWTWWFMNNSTIRLQQNPTFLFENPGTYPVALVVKNKWGCADTVVKNITINEDFAIYLPNTFTPNDDGINDVFAPKGLGVVKYTMTIYDRWGEKLFTTNDFTKGWDGTYKGVNCKNDVYVYKMSYYNNQDKKIDKTGHVTISR